MTRAEFNNQVLTISMAILKGFNSISWYDVNDFLAMDNKEILEKNGGKRFDCILINPPYDKSLHLKFLEKVIQLGENVVSIQPVRWLQDITVQYKKGTDYKKYENSISKHIKDLEIIDANISTKVFGADFTMKTAIYHIDSNNEYDVYKDVKYDKDGFDIHFIKQILDKIVSENNFSKMNIKKFNKDLHNFIPLNYMTGENIERCKPTNVIKEWTKAYKNADEYIYDKSHKSGVARGKIENDSCVVFDTLEEAQNCYNSFTKSKFTRFYMSAITIDIHINHNCMPWMNDYTKPWDDNRFYKHFNIDKTNQEKIEKYADKIIKRLNNKSKK